MFKMSAFGIDTGSQTTLPLINGVIHNALFQSTPHGDKTLSQLVDVMDSSLIHALEALRNALYKFKTYLLTYLRCYIIDQMT